MYAAIDSSKIDATTEQNIINAVQEKVLYTIDILDGRSKKYKDELLAVIDSLKAVDANPTIKNNGDVVSSTKLKLSIRLISLQSEE